MSEITEFQIARLELRPGDVLVVKTPHGVNIPRDRITVQSLVPAGVRILFIPPEVDLSVLTRAEIEALP